MKNYLLITSVLLILLSCKKESENRYQRTSGNVFGTTYSIIYDDSKEYQQAFDSLFNAVNKSLSTYIPTSDISKINNGDTTVVIDDYFVEVFNKSKRIYKETNGYFDPTIGQLINAYGFGSKKEKNNLTETQISDLMKFVGFDKIDLVDRKIIKKNNQIKLDVNAIAKGYGIDVIARFLEEQDIKSYLVEIGGEIRCKGLKNNKKWKVAIEKPNTDGTQSFQKTIELTNQSMATSGNYRKFRIDENGKKYVHIVNPHTGLAQESNLLSVSVIADLDCADVDAYATAFMVMGFEKTKQFLEKHPDIKVILLYVDKTGKVVEYAN